MSQSGVVDPLAMEKSFGKIESAVAPLLRVLANERRGIRDDFELGTLVEFMAIQAIRVPTFRAFVKRTTMKHLRERLLRNRQTWEDALRAASIPLDRPSSDYSRVVQAVDSGGIYMVDDPAFHLKQGANQLQAIDDGLKRRKWHQLFSQKGLFIASDNPVVLDGEQNQRYGFSNAPLVVFPVNRFLLLCGSHEDAPPITVTTKLIAEINTSLMMSADEQVYSHRPDFYWLDSEGRCQNDWTRFNRSDFPEVRIGP